MVDAIRPLPDTLDVEDGYPSEERIQQIRVSNDVVNGPQWLVNTFPCLVNDMGYGRCTVSDGTDELHSPVKIVQVSTGGWSGQEELISAVEHSLLGTFYLFSWRRGGHYEFRVPVDHLVRNSASIPQPPEDARLVDLFAEPEMGA